MDAKWLRSVFIVIVLVMLAFDKFSSVHGQQQQREKLRIANVSKQALMKLRFMRDGD